jgi:hypothetical protein
MWTKIAIMVTTATSLVVFTGAQGYSAPELIENHQNYQVKVVFSLQDIPGGILIDSSRVEERFVPADQVPSNHIVSIAEAVGKVTPEGMAIGTIICRNQLALPTRPKPRENWLLYYSTSELSKRIGTKVAIKGFLTDWIIGGEHKDNDCAILSSDELTYVRIGLPCETAKSKTTASEKHMASTQRASWLKNVPTNGVVIARGVLRRCESKSTKGNGPRSYLLLDQKTLTVTKSSWLN